MIYFNVMPFSGKSAKVKSYECKHEIKKIKTEKFYFFKQRVEKIVINDTNRVQFSFKVVR